MLPRNRRRAGIAVLAATFLSLLISFPTGVASAAPPDLTNEDVSFRSGDVTLHGTVVAPASNGTRRPAMVMVHGAGIGTKRERFRAEAEAFARAGIVTLIFDKNRAGYSRFSRSYSSLADDALAALRELRQRSDVDLARVGLWGLSEGGWVVPLAASRSADVAFLVLVGANGVSPARAQAWSYGEWLRRQGVSGSLPEMVQTTGMRVITEAGMFPEPDYDPVPVLERVSQPVLGLWGAHDKQTPAEEGARIMRDSLERGGNSHYTIRVFPDGQHSLRKTTDGFDKKDEFAAGYLDLVGSWVNGLADGAPAATSDPLPKQDRHTVALAPLAWYESVGVQLGALVLLVVAFGGYPLVALARRLRGRRGAPPAARPARWLAGGGLLATLGLCGFVFFVAATGGQSVGPVVAGRPVLWLLLQLVALGAVVAAGWTALAGWRDRDELPLWARVRLGLLLAGGAVFVPWALYWGLLIP